MKFKKGDSVVCVANDGGAALTLGKRYEVLSSGDDLVEVQNDEGFQGPYYSRRFKINESDRVLKILSYYD